MTRFVVIAIALAALVAAVTGATNEPPAWAYAISPPPAPGAAPAASRCVLTLSVRATMPPTRAQPPRTSSPAVKLPVASLR